MGSDALKDLKASQGKGLEQGVGSAGPELHQGYHAGTDFDYYLNSNGMPLKDLHFLEHVIIWLRVQNKFKGSRRYFKGPVE